MAFPFRCSRGCLKTNEMGPFLSTSYSGHCNGHCRNVLRGPLLGIMAKVYVMVTVETFYMDHYSDQGEHLLFFEAPPDNDCFPYTDGRFKLEKIMRFLK